MLWAGPLGDGQHGQVGQHGADRDVRAGGPALPPRGHGLGHAAGLALQGPDVLEAQPGGLGSSGPTGACRSSSHSARAQSSRPSSSSCAAEPVVEVEQVRHVARRVGHLVVRERPAQPVGQTVGLGQADLELAVDQRRQRRRGVAEEAGGELGVEQAGRHGPAGVGEHVEVLLGGVEHGQPGTGEQRAPAPGCRRERVDQGQLVVPGQLHQGQLGVVVRSRWNSVSRA